MKIALTVLGLLLATITMAQNHQTKPKMKVAVWDTYVTRKDGKTMHFDIIAPQSMKDTSTIYNYGKDYLKGKNQEGQPLTSKECKFCHVESATSDMMESIGQKGYFIIEMENCE